MYYYSFKLNFALAISMILQKLVFYTMVKFDRIQHKITIFLNKNLNFTKLTIEKRKNK